LFQALFFNAANKPIERELARRNGSIAKLIPPGKTAGAGHDADNLRAQERNGCRRNPAPKAVGKTRTSRLSG